MAIDGEVNRCPGQVDVRPVGDARTIYKRCAPTVVQTRTEVSAGCIPILKNRIANFDGRKEGRNSCCHLGLDVRLVPRRKRDAQFKRELGLAEPIVDEVLRADICTSLEHGPPKEAARRRRRDALGKPDIFAGGTHLPPGAFPSKLLLERQQHVLDRLPGPRAEPLWKHPAGPFVPARRNKVDHLRHLAGREVGRPRRDGGTARMCRSADRAAATTEFSRSRRRARAIVGVDQMLVDRRVVHDLSIDLDTCNLSSFALDFVHSIRVQRRDDETSSIRYSATLRNMTVEGESLLASQRPDRSAVADWTLARLHEMVFDGQLAPGDVLTETDLTATLGVSRSPVRDALKELEHSGLINVDRVNGRRILRAFGADDIAESYDVRLELESLAARYAAQRASDAAFRGLSTAYEDMVGALEASLDVWLAVDFAFHASIAAASGGHRLPRMLAGIWLQQQAFLRRMHRGGVDPSTREQRLETLPKHEQILAAIRAQDVAASDAAVRHLVRGRREIMLAKFLEMGFGAI